MDAGEEKINDEDLTSQARLTAKRIHRRALITATVIALVALVFPQPKFWR